MHIALGILLLNLHNPVYTAETVASLDVLSRGRLIFGVGLGYRDPEFDAFAVPKGKRVARFEEYLELVQRLWTEDNVSHNSETCVLNNVRMNIRPIQKPSPPIWLAANNDKAIEAPPISFFIFLIEFPGLILTPPVSKVTPFPIITIG